MDKDKKKKIIDMDTEWDFYSGLPNPMAYVNEEAGEGSDPL